ncbi:helix-turn-helix transcriptional regulator [Plantactinospora mayteni]|uniref:Transcriptional regulator n=1 Tax=Plantactinospora mayteni TaxID=566021 RepID=A0ABQ4EQM8_9ACTN|nr:helix-turn-helix transcriptional regulator [Plantactinospora mayteni]GIG96930.1 transcriptional regulator [Plantactinospora mayteni]
MNDLREILREQRAKHRMSQEKCGAAIKVSGSLIAQIETGRIIPQDDTAQALDDLFGTEDEIQRATEAARDDARPPWLRPWTDHEQQATLLRTWEPNLIPGLLQTEAYTRLVCGGGRLSKRATENTVQVRRDRQAATIGRADEPPMLSAIIGETALRCGPGEVLKEQLRHLVEATHLSHVQLLVVPWAAGVHAGSQGAFVLATLPGRGRVGYVDDQLRGRLVTDPKDLDGLELSWEIATGLALPVHQSRDFIEKAIKDHD